MQPDDSRATTTSEPATRAMRADARRNRARILEAADAVFADEGTSASTEEVARAAGVGIGTVFRHFPTKDALLEAVFVARLQQLADDLDALSTTDDPGTAFFAFFDDIVDQAATKHALVDALAATGIDVAQTTARLGQDLLRALDPLLTRAQQAGAVRSDVDVADVIALVIGVSRAVEHSRRDPQVQERTLAVVRDGLRPPPDHRP